MESFTFTLMFLSGVILLKYILTHIQCRRAIDLASIKSIRHIHKCEKAFKIINHSDIDKQKKEKLASDIKKVLRSHEIYFKEYFKDYDFNNLWISPDKWTLDQMFPNLTNTNDLIVMIDGVEL